MIIVRLSGGLGNQLFQYAFARAYAHTTGKRIVLDIGQLNKASTAGAQRLVEIDKFSISLPLKNMSLFRIFSKLFGKDVIEPSFIYNKAITDSITSSSYVSGIWQTEKYFSFIRDILLKEITPKDPISPSAQAIQANIDAKESISVHIRRGDYVADAKTNSKHGVCPPDYYDRAIKYIVSHTTNPQFFVFSDDIAWAEEHMKFPDSTIFVSDPNIKAHEEMLLMSHCKHNIIANSSFSWWGAWLNKNPSKIIIAPQKWFNVSISTQDLLPTSWIQL